MHLRQLVYVSAATGSPDDKELNAILEASHRNNSGADVTGMLLYIDKGFLQILEGPPDRVEEIYQRILRDPRHTAQRVVVDKQTDERLFGQWSMGFDHPSAQRISSDSTFAITRDVIANAVSSPKAVEIAALLRAFYRVNDRD